MDARADAAKPEFDLYAQDYEALLRDPIRERFATEARFFHERKWALLKSATSRLSLDHSKCVWIDVGCGKGELLRLGKGHMGEVIGCDPAAGMLDGADDIRVVHQEELLLLPFADASADLVTAVCVYHHVRPADRAALTSEVGRILKPGGVFGVIEHNPYNPATRLIVSRTPVDADAILLTASSSRRMLAEAGFAIASTRYFLFFPEKLYRRRSRIEDALAWLPLGGQYAVFATKCARKSGLP
jgi:SAM-dependent methyltransferase